MTLEAMIKADPYCAAAEEAMSGIKALLTVMRANGRGNPLMNPDCKVAREAYAGISDLFGRRACQLYDDLRAVDAAEESATGPIGGEQEDKFPLSAALKAQENVQRGESDSVPFGVLGIPDFKLGGTRFLREDGVWAELPDNRAYIDSRLQRVADGISGQRPEGGYGDGGATA